MSEPLHGPALLHLSDLHFGREDTQALRALQALAERLRPAAVVVTGDITQRATPAQFVAARDWLQRLPTPHLVVQPGNHDIPLWAWWERWLAPRRRYRRHFGPDVAPSLDLPWLHLVTVDSVARLRHSRGALSARQIDEVAMAIAASGAQQLRVVALHHPLVAEDGAAPLRQAALAARRWAAAGVDIVLGGHMHRPLAVPLAAPHGVPARGAGPWAVLGGTAGSTRLRGGAPASVNLIAPDPLHGAAWLQRWDHDAAAGDFVAAAPQRLALRRLSALSDTPTARRPIVSATAAP